MNNKLAKETRSQEAQEITLEKTPKMIYIVNVDEKALFQRKR